MQILQMSTLELQDFINQQVLNNPLLDYEEHLVTGTPEAVTPDPLATLYDESYDNYWTDRSTSYTTPDSKQQFLESLEAPRADLHMHLRQQIQEIVAEPLLKLVAEHLIDDIDENGYIRTDLTAWSQEHQIDPALTLGALSLIQSCDPAGVGARSLEECLTLQIRERFPDSHQTELQTLISHLRPTFSQGHDALARACNTSTNAVRTLLKMVRGLDPKPGLQYNFVTPESRQIDLYVAQDKSGKWLCELNPECMPALLVNSHLFHDLRARMRDPKEIRYIQKNYNDGRWLIKTLHQRYTTLRNVGQHIIEYQERFLTQGPSALVPLTLRDIAQALNMHESTMSRTIANKYILTPFGLSSLKAFLTTGIHQPDGTERSSAQIQQAIKNFISEEDPQTPLSDTQIVHRLKEMGMCVARRTVAKYRESLHIPTSFARKRKSQLMTF